MRLAEKSAPNAELVRLIGELNGLLTRLDMLGQPDQVSRAPTIPESYHH